MLVSTLAGSTPQASRQQPGVRVVVGQPLDVVVEGVQPGGREDADLPHPAAHPLAPDPRLGDGVGASRPPASRPARRAPWTGRRPARRRTAPYSASGTPVATWAFQIRAPSRWIRDADLVGPRRAAPQVRERQHRAAGEVVGVLDRDRGGAHEERAHVGREHRAAIAGRSTPPARVGPGAHRQAGVGAVGAELGAGDVGARTRRAPPGRAPTSDRTASTLAIEPVGVNSAASWPNRPATRSWSAGPWGPRRRRRRRPRRAPSRRASPRSAG